MGFDTTLAVLYAQSGLSNQANAAMVAPQASLAMTRVLAAEQARQERQQIEKSEKTEGPSIRPDQGGKRGFFQSRLNARRQSKQEEAPRTTPTLGNLLNVTV